jgi:hypothetical protein
VASDEVSFPVRLPVDEEGYRVVKLRDDGRFESARNGDHLMTEFQCPLCHVRNMYGRNPGDDDPLDQLVMKVYLPQAILDAFWSRESSTVNGNRYNMVRLINTPKKIRMVQVLPLLGPKTLSDLAGMSCAVSFLNRTLDSGKNEEFIQYHTARGVHTAFTNLWNVLIFGEDETIAVGGKCKMHTTTSPAMGNWYTRFDKGAQKRMGDLSCQDASWTPELMTEIMIEFERDWSALMIEELWTLERRKKQAEIVFPALMGDISYVLGLRGEELPLMDLIGTKCNTNWGKIHPKTKHGVIVLLVRFKNEVGEKYYLMPVPLVTNSGWEPIVWMERMFAWYDSQGTASGPVFCNKKGECGKYGDFDHSFLTRVAKVQDRSPELFAKPDGNVFDDYSLGRSGRRSTTSRSLNVGLDTQIIETNNRWRVRERAKGSDPNQNMIQHYVDVLVILDALLAFPQAM